jgi:hypothetical protein
MRKIKKQDRTANGGVRSDSLFQANLEAFVSIGLVQNDFISGICRMDHVTPGYILGQKKRLEAERRYSAGLLLKVIQCKDSLPNKYITCDSSPPSSNGAGASVPPLSRGAGGDSPEIEPDPSIHEPLSPSGMTAARAWSAVLRELQMDMPKAAYDKWVRRAVLLSARDGTFVIGAYNGFARDWLESRLTRTITRLLAGSCNRAMEVKFADRQGVRPCRSAKQEI